MDIVLENKNYKLIKTDESKYSILDKQNSVVLKLEGEFTEEQLKEQLNNCFENAVII